MSGNHWPWNRCSSDALELKHSKTVCVMDQNCTVYMISQGCISGKPVIFAEKVMENHCKLNVCFFVLKLRDGFVRGTWVFLTLNTIKCITLYSLSWVNYINILRRLIWFSHGQIRSYRRRFRLQFLTEATWWTSECTRSLYLSFPTYWYFVKNTFWGGIYFLCS